MKLSPSLMKLVLRIRAAGGSSLVVGGTVRDKFMWRASNDVDLEVYGLHPDTLAEVCSTVGDVNAVGKSFGVLKVRLLDEDLTVDVSVPRTENKIGRGHRGFMVTPSPNMTPRDAAGRRDFTVNSLAMDPITGEVLDFYGGREDIDNGVLRATTDAFMEDPLRVLRGMQFASRFYMEMDGRTAAMSLVMRDEYSSLPVERIWIEWKKWATGRHPSKGLKLLEATGWDALYSPFGRMQVTVQDKEWHPEGTVWDHTLFAVDAASNIAVRDKLTEEDRLVLVLAALCHDMGKVDTTVIDLITDRVTSPGHAEEGVFLAGKFLQKLGTPEGVQARVLSLVGEHMWAAGGNITPRSVRRLAHRLGAVGNSIMDLARLVDADRSARPPLPGGLCGAMQEALVIAEANHVEDQGPIPIMLGRHLIEMGFSPGPIFKSILNWCMEQQLEGNLTSVEMGKVLIEDQQARGVWKWLT